MLYYFSLIDNSDSGSLAAGILLMYIIIALTIAVPTALIGWALYQLAKGSKAKKSGKNRSSKNTLPPYLPYVIGITGLILVVANIGGSKYSDKPILLDSILLALPFILGLIASLAKISLFTRKLLLVAIIYSAFIFLSYHYL